MNKVSSIKDIPTFLQRKKKRTIVVADNDSDGDSSHKSQDSETELINLNYDKYCYLCHKEIIPSVEEHSFFKCRDCSKYFHKDCYKEASLKKIEKNLLKDAKILNVFNQENNNKENNTIILNDGTEINFNNLYGKECILCILQNSKLCCICHEKINYDENNLIIKCELCGNLIHFNCLDVPLYFILYREYYKFMFEQKNSENSEKYPQFLRQVKEFQGEVNFGTLSEMMHKLNIEIPENLEKNIFYVCNFCKRRNFYDMQEINIYCSRNFSKVNYYNTILNPISQNFHRVKKNNVMNKVHEMYISCSTPYTDAKFDEEKYDTDYNFPFPIKLVKKFQRSKINNTIITKLSVSNEREDKKEITEKTDINTNVLTDNNNQKIENETHIINSDDNIESNEFIIKENLIENYQENNINEIEFKSFYLVKWNTNEYSIEFSDFLETFQNFNDLLIDFQESQIIAIEKEKNKKRNFYNELHFHKTVLEIIKQKTQDGIINNFKQNCFIYKKENDLNKYKDKVKYIITSLFNNSDFATHILILTDLNSNFNSNNCRNFYKFLNTTEYVKNDYVDLNGNKQTFFYECLNIKEDFYDKNNNEYNILTLKNNIYLNRNKNDLLDETIIKRYLRPGIIIDNINSINLTFLQNFHFDMIIFDLVDVKNLIAIKEYFKQITNPLNVNYKSFLYLLVEENNNNHSSNFNEKLNINVINIEKTILKFFDLFYCKEETLLLYGNYSGNQKFISSNTNNEETKENLKYTNLINENKININVLDYDRNFINLNYSTLKYDENFSGFKINNKKWIITIDKNLVHFTQILVLLYMKYNTQIYTIRTKLYSPIIMNFIPISLDKETFIQYLYIIKNKPEILLKTQENKKDLIQNILLLCSLPCCMTKYYKKYLDDYKVPIKDDINIAKIDIFYQLSRYLLYNTKGKVIVIFPLHDKVYRENESVLRKIRKEIEKVFFSNLNLNDKNYDFEKRKKNFYCFLIDEDGLFEEISAAEKYKDPTHIILFNMFLQNKNTAEFFNAISQFKNREKIILYQMYINNLIEGKLSQIFYSKLNQFIDICSLPQKKIKSTVYGQLTLIEKEIITISDLKKTYEMHLNNSNSFLNTYTINDLSKLNIVTSYEKINEKQNLFDGNIYITKNSYLLCTNSNNINLKFNNIYKLFVGNISFNNTDGNFSLAKENNNIKDNLFSEILNDDDYLEISNNNISNYNNTLLEFQKKKFYFELDFLKDENNFEKLKQNRCDLTKEKNNENVLNSNNNSINQNNNSNIRINNNDSNNINENNNNNNENQNRNEEVYVLNDSTENINSLAVNNQRKRRGRKKKINQGNNNNSSVNLNTNNNKDVANNNNNEFIQIVNDEENEELNGLMSDGENRNNLMNNGNFNDIDSRGMEESLDENNQNENNNNINVENNQNENNNNGSDYIPVNLDEITEEYSDTISENPNNEQPTQQQQNCEQSVVNNENNHIEQQDNNVDSDNNQINSINEETNINSEKQATIDNTNVTKNIIQDIANQILNKNKDVNKNNNNNTTTNNNNQSNTNSSENNNIINNNSVKFTNEELQEAQSIEILLNEMKSESSRDKLFKIYNYFLSKGFDEKTRKLFLKCLLNYGFPLIQDFSKFYILFSENAKNANIKKIPNKMDSEFYYELIYFILDSDEYLDYNIFTFGTEKTSSIRTKLNVIRQFQSIKDLSKAMYFFVKEKGNILFGHLEPKLEENYQRVSFVIAKILSNLVTKSIKSGFLNYKKYIKDDDVIFDNIRIKKEGQTTVFNIREGISKKIFGKAMTENEFNNTIEMYYNALFSQYIKYTGNGNNNVNA